jgi:hypothetical protein
MVQFVEKRLFSDDLVDTEDGRLPLTGESAESHADCCRNCSANVAKPVNRTESRESHSVAFRSEVKLKK